MTPAQIQALRAACDAIIEAVKAAGPTGAPAGTLYSALMAHGCTLNQFNALTGGLVSAGKLRRSGDIFHAI